jgi:hypothetical protein
MSSHRQVLAVWRQICELDDHAMHGAAGRLCVKRLASS